MRIFSHTGEYTDRSNLTVLVRIEASRTKNGRSEKPFVLSALAELNHCR